MAATTGTDAERPPNFKEQGEQIGLGLTEPAVATRTGRLILATLQEWLAWVIEFILKNAGRIVVFFATSLSRGEDRSDPVFRELTDAAIRDLTGADPSQGHAAVGRQLLNAMTGGRGAAADGDLQPSTAGAESYMEMVMQLALEGYLEGGLFQALSLGYLSKFGDLDDILAKTLGISRATRAVMRPILNARVVTPTTWHVNRVYRPQLLAVAEVARQVARGRWTREQGIEELARQGYSNDRIEAIFNAQRKFFSPSDIRTFVNRDYWTRDQGIAHLKDQGYEEQAALDALRLEGLHRVDQLEDAQARAIVAAYADRRINRSTMQGMLRDVVTVASERALVELLAETQLTLNTRALSLSQVEAMVKSGVLNFLDYRNTARRDGYAEGDVTALELQLRWEMNKARDLADHRAQQEAERAAERTARDEAAARRRAEIAAQRALAQRGPLSKLERAAVRGLISLARVEEVYAAQYDADAVAFLLDLLEGDRADYVDQQQRAEDAASRAGQRGLSIGELQAAVMVNHLTVAEFERRVADLGLSAEDAALLTATTAARKADQDEAKRLRDEARAKAGKRSIDLGRLEQLVRRGARTVAQYEAQLVDLGYDDPDRAAMVDFLQLQIAEDAAARDARAQANAALRARGLSLDQFERAVVLGATTIDAYGRFLVEQGFTVDAQVALVALLQAKVDEANAARARREAVALSGGRRELPLAAIRRAARLGVISPDVYAGRLARDGYTDDDIAIDVELLLQEIADVQERRLTRDQAEAAAATRNLSLAQLERAVKRGLATIDDYAARAAELGYSGADFDLLVGLLTDELAQATEAKDRREQIAGDLATRALNLSQLEEAVKKGLKTVDAFTSDIVGLGYSDDDAELLTALLVVDLETTAGSTGG